jgi:hypothetical protein
MQIKCGYASLLQSINQNRMQGFIQQSGFRLSGRYMLNINSLALIFGIVPDVIEK